LFNHLNGYGEKLRVSLLLYFGGGGNKEGSVGIRKNGKRNQRTWREWYAEKDKKWEHLVVVLHTTVAVPWVSLGVEVWGMRVQLGWECFRLILTPHTHTHTPQLAFLSICHPLIIRHLTNTV